MLFVVHDPGKGKSRLFADFQIQRFSFRLEIKAQPKAKATGLRGIDLRSALFDRLVGKGQQRLREDDSQRPGSLEVD
jgi:hypothetical protein